MSSSSGRFLEGDFETYVIQMRQPHVWEGAPELLMSSRPTKCSVRGIQPIKATATEMPPIIQSFGRIARLVLRIATFKDDIEVLFLHLILTKKLQASLGFWNSRQFQIDSWVEQKPVITQNSETSWFGYLPLMLKASLHFARFGSAQRSTYVYKICG